MKNVNNLQIANVQPQGVAWHFLLTDMSFIIRGEC